MSAVTTLPEIPVPEHPIAPFLRMDRIPHIWCPTCGIGTVVKCYATALEGSALDLDKVAIVSGIGCTGRVAGYMKLDAFHTTHGRAVPFATGVADCSGPVTSAVRVTDITDDSAIVRWNTSEPATSYFEWGLTPALGNPASNSLLFTSHQYPIAPLAECSRVYFRAYSTDVYGNTRLFDNSGAPYEFTTYRRSGPSARDALHPCLGAGLSR